MKAQIPSLRAASRRLPAFTGSLFLSLSAASHGAGIIASDGAQDDVFGIAGAISGNIGLVAASGDDDNGSGSGSAYVFRGLDTATGTVTQSVKLQASDGVASDRFGRSASISGNAGLLGAPVGVSGNSNLGAAYLFRGLDTATGTVNEDAQLIASDVAAFDRFGQSVTLSGNKALVGADGDSDNGGLSGSAYLFRGLDTATGTVNESAKLLPSDGMESESFGISSSLSGNIGLVGASGSTRRGARPGSAYLFRGLDTATDTVNEDARLVASDGATGDTFGSTVSLSGNAGLVGAREDDDSGNASGSAYLFRGLDTAAGEVNEDAKLLASDAAAGDLFGQSVSLSGNTGLVGANGDDDNGNSSGSAYLFRGLDTAPGTVTESVKLRASDGAAGDSFGFSVAVDGDNFIIGAFSGDGAVTDSGKAYTGSVSSVTVLDSGATSRTISGISFTSREDWIIGETTDGNSVTLSAGDTATVAASGNAVYIGKEAGSDNNTLNIAGILEANAVNIGAQTGSAGNTLRLESTADITNAVAFIMGESSILSIEGDLTGAGELLTYLDTTTLQVWDGAGLTQVTNLNQSTLLNSTFTGGFTNFTSLANFVPVPEPSALMLSAVGILAMIRRRR